MVRSRDRILGREFAGAQIGGAAIGVAGPKPAFRIHMHIAEVDVAGTDEARRGVDRRTVRVTR